MQNIPIGKSTTNISRCRLTAFRIAAILRNLLLLLLLAFQTANALAADSIKLGLITLGDNVEHPFWGAVGDLMEEATGDLGMELVIYDIRTKQDEAVQAIRQAHADGVDALVMPNVEESALDLLDLIEQLEIPTFLINADINERYKADTGGPREKYRYWLGRMLPDEEQAGYLLGKSLIEKALLLHPVSSGRQIELAAITGTFVDTPSILRVSGLKKVVSEYPSVVLNQVVYAQWSLEEAYNLTKKLLQRYPDTSAFWTASDAMGLGVMQYLYESEDASGSKKITGGVDWSINGVEALADDHFVASTGGHILEGAWAAILLFDYFNGVDFADTSLEFDTEMRSFEVSDSELYLQRHENRDWSDIDFRQFSRHLNPALRNYDFSPLVLIEK